MIGFASLEVSDGAEFSSSMYVEAEDLRLQRSQGNVTRFDFLASLLSGLAGLAYS